MAIVPTATTSQDLQKVENYQVNVPQKEINTESIQYLTNSDSLRMAFYSAFCGWREYTKEDMNKILGSDTKKFTQAIKVDEFARLCNEAGGNYLYASIKPLISHLATTSNMTDIEIYNLWNGKLKSIKWALIFSYVENNPYELDMWRLGDIITTLCELYAITKKARGGFTLREIAESFQTATINKMGEMPQAQKRGLFDGLFKK